MNDPLPEGFADDEFPTETPEEVLAILGFDPMEEPDLQELVEA